MSEDDAKRLRSPLFGSVLIAVGGALFAAAFCAWQLDLGPTASPTSRLLSMLGYLLVGGLGSLLVLVGRKLRAPTAEQILARDSRPPVLYLRSFRSDQNSDILGKIGPGRRTVEQFVLSGLARVGPCVAIGKPGERLPELGAARMYVSDERWRDEVSLLMKKAALVMLRIGTSEGFWWEIEQVVATVPPERVLFLLDWQDGGSAAAYERFRERARTVLPQPLPKQGGEALFLAFGSKWEPMFLGSPEHLFQGAALRDPAYIENDLAPLLQRYGIKPRRIGALGRGAVIIIVVSLVLGAVLISLML